MNYCPIVDSKQKTANKIIDLALEQTGNSRPNLIWLEANGCSGNIISFLDSENPNAIYVINELTTLRYNNSIMAAEGEAAYKLFLDTLNTKFILVVEGAVSLKDNGLYNVIARYNGKLITAMEAVKLAGANAEYIITAGTCASYGGITTARPNPSMSVSAAEFLEREVIRTPGCPVNPDWLIGTLAHLVAFGVPELDSQNRPIIFYGITIHDNCPRRAYFDNGIFARKLGDVECMFKLGCRGPVTRTDCPTRQWNGHVNWPIGDNTPCIGCANARFPDGMEPFVRY